MNEIVHSLKIAETPVKQEMLSLIEEMRIGVENGTIISLVMIPIHPQASWSTRSAGEIGMLELSGLLGRVWFDAVEALKDVGR
jgi:hypothetical protein